MEERINGWGDRQRHGRTARRDDNQKESEDNGPTNGGDQLNGQENMKT